jgi:hypothetical protein
MPIPKVLPKFYVYAVIHASTRALVAVRLTRQEARFLVSTFVTDEHEYVVRRAKLQVFGS